MQWEKVSSSSAAKKDSDADLIPVNKKALVKEVFGI